jgi:hypothetical protein
VRARSCRGPVIAALCLVALAAPGCSFGFGSSYVGQWRAQEKVRFRVCVEDEAGSCREEHEVRERLPARRFWGVEIFFPNLGPSLSSIDGLDEVRFRLEGGLEFMRGRGRLALGLRATALAEFGPDATALAYPIIAVGHLGISDRFSTYAGLGWSPHTSFEIGAPLGISRRVARAVAGLQVVLNHTHGESRFLWTVEIDRMGSLGGSIDYASWGLTSHFGIAL